MVQVLPDLETKGSILATEGRRLIVARRSIVAGPVIAGSVIVDRPSGPLCLGLGTASDALCHPRALAGASAALTAPNTAAARAVQVAGAAGRLAAGLHSDADCPAG